MDQGSGDSDCLIQVQVFHTLRQELLSSLVYGQKSSGDLVSFLNLFSVNEFHSLNDFRQVGEAA